MTMLDTVIIRQVGQIPYLTCWQDMKTFTDTRHAETTDELWVVEHPPVFTQGQNGKAEHILDAGNIPVIPVDRGGQVTYHGPGQWVIYTLVDVRRKKWNVRQLVTLLEQSVIQFLKSLSIDAVAKCDAPGVYVDQKKICSIGLRIRKGSAYHGLAFNVEMDLSPYRQINPCGFAQLKMTQLAHWVKPTPAVTEFILYLCQNLGYTTRLISSEPWHGN